MSHSLSYHTTILHFLEQGQVEPAVVEFIRISREKHICRSHGEAYLIMQEVIHRLNQWQIPGMSNRICRDFVEGLSENSILDSTDTTNDSMLAVSWFIFVTRTAWRGKLDQDDEGKLAHMCKLTVKPTDIVSLIDEDEDFVRILFDSNVSDRLATFEGMLPQIDKCDPTQRICELYTLYTFINTDDSDKSDRNMYTFPYIFGFTTKDVATASTVHTYRHIVEGIGNSVVKAVDARLILDIINTCHSEVSSELQMCHSRKGDIESVDMVSDMLIFVNKCCLTIQGYEQQLTSEVLRLFTQLIIENPRTLSVEKCCAVLELLLLCNGIRGNELYFCNWLHQLYRMTRVQVDHSRLSTLLITALQESIKYDVLKHLTVQIDSTCNYALYHSGEKTIVKEISPIVEAALKVEAIFYTLQLQASSKEFTILVKKVSIQMKQLRQNLQRWGTHDKRLSVLSSIQTGKYESI